MVRVICMWRSTPAGLKPSKQFGITEFSVAKDSQKVLIIIICCFLILILILIIILECDLILDS